MRVERSAAHALVLSKLHRRALSGVRDRYDTDDVRRWRCSVHAVRAVLVLSMSADRRRRVSADDAPSCGSKTRNRVFARVVLSLCQAWPLRCSSRMNHEVHEMTIALSSTSSRVTALVLGLSMMASA